MSKQQKTKQGMASIYVVVFVTMLIGVITLSFLRIMLSEAGRTENSTLADSAMNSAMAGVEDAKTIMAKYESCKSSSTPTSECTNIVNAIDHNDKTDCDLGQDVAGESAIGFSGESYRGEINDQAYTCVNIALEGNYEGEINSDKPVMVVPLRTKGSQYTSVEKVRVTWLTEGGSGADLVSFDDGNYKNDVTTPVEKGVLGKKGINSDDNISKQNGIKVTLIQSANGVPLDMDAFYASRDDNHTNRGTLTLLPSSDGLKDIDKTQFAKSAQKTSNSPIAVKCDDVCVATIGIPKPKDGEYVDRDPNTFFLVLSGVYAEPSIDRVTIEMLSGSDEAINFYNVQPIVDSTGRAGDMLRRVEVRLGADYSSLVPLSELTVNSDLNKNFFVTKNCIKGTTSCD